MTRQARQSSAAADGERRGRRTARGAARGRSARRDCCPASVAELRNRSAAWPHARDKREGNGDGGRSGRGGLRDPRRRLRRLRAGGAAFGGREHQGHPARSRPLGPQPVDPHPHGLRAPLRHAEIRLELQDGSRAGAGRARDVLAARQGHRRLGQRQRPGVPARLAPRLRPLGAIRRPRLELRGLPARLPQAGDLRRSPMAASTAARTARCASPRCPIRRRAAAPSWKPAWRSASRAAGTSTANGTRASRRTSSTSTRGGAGARPSPISAPP